jgi:colanic acid/amylovoran biosynthesis glycosyltransferase
MHATQPFLVYRDRIGVPSEIEFLRRQYIGFTRLHPVWTGRTKLPGASLIGDPFLRVGGDGAFGPVHRFLFRHLQHVPPMALPAGTTILHAQFARGGALALPLVRRFGLRMAVTLHGGDISKRKNWTGTVLAQRWPDVVRTTERFVCVSAAVAEVAAHHDVPTEKLVVLPIGVELSAQPPLRRPTAHLPAAHLFVGRFVEKKGIAVLADAIRRLRAQGDQTPLVCVGDGPLRPVLQALARDVANISLTGWLSPDEVRVHMTEAVALLVPSITAGDGDAEGLPSVIAEAMAQACPVIGSDQGGIAEAIRRDFTGLLVPPGDAAALADAMHRLGQDDELRDRLGAAGFTEAAASLNARNQSKKLETLLLSM